MKQINEQARLNIRKAIRDIEKNTDGEIVCIITKQSGRYLLYPILIAALLALILPVLNTASVYWGDGSDVITFSLQSIAFLVFVILFTMTGLRYTLTPRAVMIDRCRRHALEQFFSQNLHETLNRTGIMLFVSFDEKYVDIIADKGINDKVEETDWQSIINEFVKDVKSNDIERAFVGAINSSGGMLTEHFPCKEKNPNELSNHLIELNETMPIC